MLTGVFVLPQVLPATLCLCPSRKLRDRFPPRACASHRFGRLLIWKFRDVEKPLGPEVVVRLLLAVRLLRLPATEQVLPVDDSGHPRLRWKVLLHCARYTLELIEWYFLWHRC